MDLTVKFENFDSSEQFTVLVMDKYDLILGMSWLEKHEPWIDWRGKAIGASRPAVSDRSLVSHVPISVRNWAARKGRLDAVASKEYLGVVDVLDDSTEVVSAGATPDRARQPCAGSPRSPPESRPVDEASKVAAPGSACQVGNQGPQTVAQTLTEEEGVEHASCVGNRVPHGAVSAPDVVIATSHDVGNEVPRRGRRRRHRRRRKSSLNYIQIGVAPSNSESSARAPQTRPVEECYHIFAGMTGRPVKAAGIHLEPLPEVSELLNLEEMAVDDFLVDLKAGEIAEVMLLKPETTPEELNSSSVLDEDVLEEMKKRREARLCSEVLKNPKNPVYPMVKGFADVVSKDPPSQLPPDRKCEVIDAFYDAKAKEGMVRESKSPHSTPTFCVRKPNGKWRLVHAYNKLNSATVPAQTPIPRKGVLLNNMAGCELYSALDLVDGYYQILMRESDIPLTAVSTPSVVLWEWLVMPQGLSNAPVTFNRLVTQLFRPLRAYAETYFDDIFVHSRAEDGKTAMEVHLGHLRRVLEVRRANMLYANIDKCVFASPEINVLGFFVSNVGVRADPEKVKAVAASPTPRSQKDLWKWLGLTNYLYKYSAEYADLARPLSELLKKDSDWRWERQHQDAYNSIKASL
ncbi:hypothetical protein PC129_g22407 [Phytophthora cactorum]|uniref:Reverse transcriptase domain-containing protein n=1 Tax=Phytophthora cactorum TaxID=29920 RepID=A0A8T1H2Y7_9STRA|nr:hypothetical protein PC111_g4718 [Phytophthora cactorum]KAG2837960.1 hypothetical protein PC112_g4723 [Phytophthora cactorum]KAG2862789.1 hypothetical protein PC113_g6001 [Phytophthora cactorum]KAG2880797.1 hypothetical protein PC115_g22414 [Phytophthora cactorum]KAG2923310.1 hypothetical protein PC114_g4850 [Phytophthora cactorum]